MIEALSGDKEFCEKVEELQEIIAYFQRRLSENEQEQLYCEQAIVDLYHDIELSSLSGADLMRDVTMLRDTLRRRRSCKELGKLAAGLIPRLQSIRDVLRHVTDVKREYKPRILLGLDYGSKGKEIA